jgi:membrane-bound lytic murein transglycosylase B
MLPSRVGTGRFVLELDRDLLGEVWRRDGVPPPIVVALWGVEGDFGFQHMDLSGHQGLGHPHRDPRRGGNLRRELLDAMKILDAGQISLERMIGSRAGAMGQCRSMPSNFIATAVDQSADERRDIWAITSHVVASTAGDPAEAGWHRAYLWDREVRPRWGLDPMLASLMVGTRPSEWRALGDRPIEGTGWPGAALSASLIAPSAGAAWHFSYTATLSVLICRDRSIYSATAVGLLADRIGAR